MIRLAFVFSVMMLLTGCLATFPSASGSDHAATFNNGLIKLEQQGKTSTLKSLAESEDESAWKDYSRSVLNIYSSQQKKIDSLKKKNKKLQDDLDKLNQINLELEKRAN